MGVGRGTKLSSNAIFAITKNVENPSRKKFYSKIFFTEPIEEQIKCTRNKDGGSSEGTRLEKNATRAYFHPNTFYRLRISGHITYIVGQPMLIKYAKFLLVKKSSNR